MPSMTTSGTTEEPRGVIDEPFRILEHRAMTRVRIQDQLRAFGSCCDSSKALTVGIMMSLLPFTTRIGCSTDFGRRIGKMSLRHCAWSRCRMAPRWYAVCAIAPIATPSASSSHRA